MVATILTITSVDSLITGLGTSSHAFLPGPLYTSAFMADLLGFNTSSSFVPVAKPKWPFSAPSLSTSERTDGAVHLDGSKVTSSPTPLRNA